MRTVCRWVKITQLEQFRIALPIRRIISRPRYHIPLVHYIIFLDASFPGHWLVGHSLFTSDGCSVLLLSCEEVTKHLSSASSYKLVTP